jgi:uncharacterized protein YcbK (DUF882 family)
LRRHCLGAAATTCAGLLLGSAARSQVRIDFSEEAASSTAARQAQSPAPSGGHAEPNDLQHAPENHSQAPEPQQEIDRSALGRMPGAKQAPSVPDFWSAPRQIWLTRRSTGQSIKTVWWADGQMRPQAYRDLSQFLGDPLMGSRIRQALQRGQPVPAQWHQAVWISPVVLDTLYALSAWLAFFAMARPIEVTSAFRHPMTNAAIEGAARDSLHQIGAAVDVIVPGVPAVKVAQFAAWMRGGGVGVYPQRGFTHLDAGRVRSWQGS